VEFKTVSELEKYLLKQISDSLQTDVALESRHLMREHIQDDVYNEYIPTHYERSWKLIDSCKTTNISNDTIELTNTRRGDEGENIPYIIEYSKGYQWGIDLDDRIGTRPFFAKTYEDLSKSKARLFIKNALNKRGFKTE